jgi:hypothetical protein
MFPVVSAADFGAACVLDGDTLAVGSLAGRVSLFVRTSGQWVFQQAVTDGATGNATSPTNYGSAVGLSGDTLVVGAPSTDFQGLGGVAYVYTRADGVWTLRQVLHAAGWGTFSEFGRSVAIEGDTVLVGAPRRITAAGFAAGAAHVFTRAADVWSEVGLLEAPDAAAGDTFGQDVALTGDTAVIGAPYRDGPGGGQTGGAYVFIRAGARWAHTQTLVGSDVAAGERFGERLAASGDRVIVGVPIQDPDGAAYVFARSGGTYTEQQKLLGEPPPGVDDSFGTSVAIDGDQALVGSLTSYKAYAFTWSGSTWVRQNLVGLAGEPPGRAVAVRGGTAAVGAPFKETSFPFPPTEGPDTVTLFALSGPTWTAQARLHPPESTQQDSFGTSLACAGPTVVVGAPLDLTQASGVQTGSVYVFVDAGAGTWSEQARLVPPSLVSGSQFGAAVVLQGDMLLAGAPGPNTQPGRVILLGRAGTTWTEQGQLAPSDGAANDFFGAALAVSGDTAVVGATGASTGGAAYVFERSGATWMEQAKLLPPDAALLDGFGRAVAVSGDVAVVGAPSADLPGAANAGAAYVFVRSGAAWTFAQKITASDAEVSDGFGSSLSLAGDELLIGSPRGDDVVVADAGAVYAFLRAGGTFVPQQRLTAETPAPFARFGAVVHRDGEHLAVGADSGAGSVHVFSRSARAFV